MCSSDLRRLVGSVALGGNQPLGSLVQVPPVIVKLRFLMCGDGSAIAFGLFRENKDCSYPSRPLLKIITLYEPDPNLLIDFKSRRIPDVN